VTREHSPLGERFGANLSRARRRAGFSQRELADLVGRTPGHLIALERGQRLPRIDTVLRLAAATEVSTCVLLGEMEWRPGWRVDGAFYVPGPETVWGLHGTAVVR
jgi:transcriptional regulator with XRE-family HTH domain